MTGIIDCHDCGRTKLADDVFECCADEVELITPQQVISEMRLALGACYTALAFELENAVKRQDPIAIAQIKHAQNLAHEALERSKP